MNHKQINMNHFWDLSLEILCLVDFENYFQDASPAFERVLGYTKDEIQGKLFTDFLHPDDLMGTLAEVKQLHLGHIAHHFENRYRHKNGSYIWLSWNAIPVPEEKLIYAIARDISWRKQAESTLQEREKFLDGILGSISDIFFTIDNRWHLTFANQVGLKATGLSYSDISGKNFWELFPDTVGNEGYVSLHHAMSERVTVEYDLYFIRWHRWYHVKAYPKAEGGLAVYAHDITERKQAEEALKGNEEKLRLMFESISDAVTVTDLNGRIIQCNEATAHMHGYARRQELIGLNALELITKADRPRATEGMKRTLEKGNIKDSYYSFIDKNGREFPGELSASVIKNMTGDPIGFIAVTKDITERKQAEEALKESEEKYRSLFANMTEAFVMGEVVLDEKGEPYDFRFLEVNKAWGKMTHISRKKAIGRTYRELFPQPIEDFIQKHGRVALTGEPASFELYSSSLNHWVIFYVYSSVKGKFASIATDITQRKRAEEALVKAKDDLEIKVKERTAELAASEEKYRSVVDNASELIVVYKEGIKFINDTGLKMLGYSREELLACPFMDFIHPADRALMAERSKRRASGEAVTNSYEFRVIHKDGSTRWLLVNAVPIQWEGKQATLGLMSDITERKLAREALRLSEEQYRSLVDNANEGISIVQDGVNKLVNKKGLEIIGYSVEHLNHKPFMELAHPDDRKSILESYQRFMAGGAVQPNYEFRIVRKDGEIRWVQINIANTTWEKRPAIMNIFTDITEHKVMEQELKNYAQKITQVQEEERKRIAYELHDDTAQYLAILKLEIDSIIQSGIIKSPEILEKLKHLEKDAGRAVDEVRRYSHDLRPGVLEHLGLVAALDQIIEDINKLKQLKVELTVEGEEKPLSEDVKLGFFRIAQEALNNCRKHSKALEASVTLKFRKNRMEMIISDDGIGFDLQEARGHTGLRGSLGLMSMQERAKLIGANLKIESKPGKGTTVTLEILLDT